MVNLNYLRYLFKKNRNQFFLVALILNLNIFLSIFGDKDYAWIQYYNSTNTMIYIIVFVLIVVNLQIFHHKRSADTYLQLPINKREVYSTNVLFILIELITCTIISFIGFHLIMARGLNLELLRILLLEVIYIIILVLGNAFIYITVNSKYDGIVLMLLHAFLSLIIIPLFLSYCSSVLFLSGRVQDFIELNNIYFNPANLLTNSLYDKNLNIIMLLIELGVVIIVNAVLWLKGLPRNISERVDEISRQWYGYPLLIHGIMFGLIMLSMLIDDSLVLTIVLILIYFAAVAMYMIKNREFRISKLVTVSFLILCLLSYGLHMFIKVNQGFGLDDYQEPMSEEVTVEYYTTDYSYSEYSGEKVISLEEAKTLYNWARDQFYNGYSDEGANYIIIDYMDGDDYYYSINIIYTEDNIETIESILDIN